MSPDARRGRACSPARGSLPFIPGIAALVLAAAAGALAAAELKPWSGRQPATFELNDLSGRSHRLVDYRGKVVLVNFWATWCEPCRDEMPTLERLKEKLAGRPFEVLAVNVDEPEARIRRFLSILPLSFTVLLDPGRQLTRSWNVRLLPATYVIAPDGTIQFSALGELDWSTREVAERIASLFPRNP